jgi:hypothetical protein
LEESNFDLLKLKDIMDKMEEGYSFVKSLYHDIVALDHLTQDAIFNGFIKTDKRGWLSSHNFSISLEILNRDKVPGKSVFIQAGIQKLPIVTYYALCPELENFVSLVNWTSSESSLNAYQQILKWRREQNDKVLCFSESCGIRLPNEIHPGRDKSAQMLEKKHFESLYNWRLAYYLLDDGDTILSHNSPVNYRKVYLDEVSKEQAFIELRTIVGRTIAVTNEYLKVMVPRLDSSPRVLSFYLSGKEIDPDRVTLDKIFSFLVFKKTGKQNVESHIRVFDTATSVDLLGIYMIFSCYLLFLGKSRLRILTENSLNALFRLLYDRAKNFCWKSNDEIEQLNNCSLENIYYGYLSAFLQKIDGDYFFIPRVMRELLSAAEKPVQKYLIEEFDYALSKNSSSCVAKIPYNEKGYRMFNRTDAAEINKLYTFINFLLSEKKIILGFRKMLGNAGRRSKYEWLRGYLGDDASLSND